MKNIIIPISTFIIGASVFGSFGYFLHDYKVCREQLAAFNEPILGTDS